VNNVNKLSNYRTDTSPGTSVVNFRTQPFENLYQCSFYRFDYFFEKHPLRESAVCHFMDEQL